MNAFPLIIPILLISGALYSQEWTRNSVYKLSAAEPGALDMLKDHNSIGLENGAFIPLSLSNNWLSGWSVNAGQGYQFDTLYVHFSSTDTDSYVVLSIHDAADDRLLESVTMDRWGSVRLVNRFEQNVSVFMEIVGTNIRVYSLGLTRKKKVSLEPSSMVVLPGLFFFDEDMLRIDFELKMPAVLDVILFDPEGRIVTYLAKKAYFTEGPSRFNWKPDERLDQRLLSGSYTIYFKVQAEGVPVIEIMKPFLFVNR